jgi:hypothetical protein
MPITAMAPLASLSPAGQEHGRTIPLTDIAPVFVLRKHLPAEGEMGEGRPIFPVGRMTGLGTAMSPDA